MNWKKSPIILILLFTVVLAPGCIPEITKDDLKVTDIIWFEVEIENETKSFARIEAEAYKAPLRALITYIDEPNLRELREMRVEYYCAKILGKGKSIITDGCMGDPAHNFYIIPNSVIEICFNYGKKLDKENRICLDPVEIGEP